MFRVGIVGCGSISAVHARVIHDLEDTTLVACADIRLERARTMAEQYDCAAFGDYLCMLDEVKPDAVHICAPHYLHPDMVREAAFRGVAAFTEKPPAIDTVGWETVLRASELVPVGICFQNRYNPNIVACREILKSGHYGALKGIRAFVTWNRTREYYAAADWKGKWATEGGGALINQAIHTLDLALGFLGTPDVAEATMTNHRLRGAIEVEDTVEIYLRRGNVPALIYASNGYSQDAPVLLELHMDEAIIRLEGDRMEVRSGNSIRECAQESTAALGRAYWGSGHPACIEDFYRSIKARAPYANSPAACDVTMRTLLTLYNQCHLTLNGSES
ncbi:MAG: Gfo/Idh/MocA family oxidoreductase [Clostridia bacterium]|nr:Gfo/Idh/MocA family oxidoreductase [Clostridia bacterium]